MGSSTALLVRLAAAGLVAWQARLCRADAIAERSDSSLATRSVTVRRLRRQLLPAREGDVSGQSAEALRDRNS
jgi:hypothetical protein